MPSLSGESRAFARGVKIAAGFIVLLLVGIVIAIVERDRPLKTSQPAPANGAGVQIGDKGPMPRADTAPTAGPVTGLHPSKMNSDLKP